MATIPDHPEDSLDIHEQIARIDRMQMEIGKWKVEMVKTIADVTKIAADTAKVRQESRLAPWQVAFTGLGAGAALFAAGAAFTKLVTG